VRVAVTYYCVMPHGKPDFSHIRAAVLGHLGASDEFLPVEAAQALEAELRDAGARARFEYYPALARIRQRQRQARAYDAPGRAALVGERNRVPAPRTRALSVLRSLEDAKVAESGAA
jgi:dienelactone hydrolase